MDLASGRGSFGFARDGFFRRALGRGNVLLRGGLRFEDAPVLAAGRPDLIVKAPGDGVEDFVHEDGRFFGRRYIRRGGISG